MVFVFAQTVLAKMHFVGTCSSSSSTWLQKGQSPLIFMPSFLSLLLNFNFYLINFHANILIREIIFNHQNAEFLKCGGI